MSQKPVIPLFRTLVDVPKPLRELALADKHVFLGSCFAEYVGKHFLDACLPTLVNPLGVMYNPMSIVRLLTTTKSCADDFVFHAGMWHTWLGDVTLSRLNHDECQEVTDEALLRLHAALAEADTLFLTLGTTRYYVYRKRLQVVANCHRLPQTEFVEKELSQEEIVSSLGEALESLHELNPRLQVVMTVSPYRYQKYGFHESQLSKSRLLLAIDDLQRLHPEWINYFPAYELVLDELRDYRFYAEDMLHPSEQAVRYIWSRLVESWMSDELKVFLARWQPIARALQHRPLHPEAPESVAFEASLQRQIVELQQTYPQITIESHHIQYK